MPLESVGQILYSQKNIKDPDKRPDLIKDFELIPLSVLIDSATLNSPKLKKQDIALSRAKIDLKDERAGILKALSFNGSYSYGNATSLSSSESTESDLSNTLRLSESARYLVGAAVKISIYDILNRKNRIDKAQLAVRETRLTREEAIADLQQQLVTLYNECKLNKKLLDLHSSNKESSALNMEMAKNKFLLSEISIAEMTNAIDSYSKAVSSFETGKVDLEISLYKLSEVSGIDVYHLIKK